METVGIGIIGLGMRGLMTLGRTIASLAQETGFRVTALCDRNPARLAEAVLELLDSPQQRRDMGREGRALVRRVYDAPVVAAAYERLYDELLMED